MAIVVDSPGVGTPVVDTRGRAWTVTEAWWEIADLTLVPCEPASTARPAAAPSDGTSAPAPRVPALSAPVHPRHVGEDDDLVFADGPIVADLRATGTLGAWTIRPPVASWCGVVLGLSGSPAWALAADGPVSATLEGPDEVTLLRAFPAPLHLDADHLTARVDVRVDLAAWLAALDDTTPPDAALDAAWSTAGGQP